MFSAEKFIREIASKAGVTIDGPGPGDPRVRDRRFFRRVLADGDLGLGESYMDGWWDAPRVDDFITKILRADLDKKVGRSPRAVLTAIFSRVGNPQTVRRSRKVGEVHYDAGTDLYKKMLGETMAYTCGYWREGATDLDAAQRAKFALICRKIGLDRPRPDGRPLRVLDIGCGFGSFLKYAAENHGIEGVGLTISAEQKKFGEEFCAGLPVEFRLEDYRDFVKTSGEKFDRIISIGMFEHVGPKNFREFFAAARGLLADDGLFLLHTIGGNRPAFATAEWIEKYIFPGGVIPGPSQISRGFEDFFVLEDWQNFGPDYDRTLLAWHENCEKSWVDLPKYDERFRRMWRYYLLSCAATFRARKNQLWQLVLSPRGIDGGFPAERRILGKKK